MDNELLVRVYNVGLGDCIYVRVPDAGQQRHILIDCGTVYAKQDIMQAALDDIENMLPEDEASGKSRLDLLVVTHRHKDHIAGFDMNLDWFKSLSIGNIWLSASMDPNHPQAEGCRKLRAFAAEALHNLSEMSLGPAFNTFVRELFNVNRYDNDDALDALRKVLPGLNNLADGKPLYVHDQTPSDQLQIFTDPTTCLHVLAPAEDIDGTYLGRLDHALLGFSALATLFTHGADFAAVSNFSENWRNKANHPQNISGRDFRRLRARLVNNALAFVLKQGELVNNTSVVLLLEWQGRRLLFTGDAQCKTARKGKFEEGKTNGCWNAMWAQHKPLLEKPLDFLKVGHHGSHNATPWDIEDEHPVNEILDALLPRTEHPSAHVIVSTARTNSYAKIPYRELMLDLGQRVANAETRYSEREHYTSDKLKEKYQIHLIPDGVPQPQRTDLHYQVTAGADALYIPVKISPLT